MTPETESCQITDPELLGALFLAGIAVNEESPLAGVATGPVLTPPADAVMSSLARKGIAKAGTIAAPWAEILMVLAQPLWSLAVVMGSHEGYSFFEYFTGGSLTDPRLVCHRHDEQSGRQISWFYSLEALMTQLTETVDIEGPVQRVMAVGDFTPKEFVVACTLLDTYRHNYFQALLERQGQTPVDFTPDDLLAQFTRGLDTDDTRWFVTLSNASLPFDFALDPHEALDVLRSLSQRDWVEIVSEPHMQYRMTESLVDIGRTMLLPQSFAAFKVEQLLDGQDLQPRSLSVVRTPQTMWMLEYKSGDGGPVRVSLNCIAGDDLSNALNVMVDEAESRTPELMGRIVQPSPPRPQPAPPAPMQSQATVLPPMAPGGGFLPPTPLPPPMPPSGANGPSLVRRDNPSSFARSEAPPSFAWENPSRPQESWPPEPSAQPWPPEPSPQTWPPDVFSQNNAPLTPSPTEVKCVHCGQMINVNKKFCRSCGGATADSLDNVPVGRGSMRADPPPWQPRPPETPWPSPGGFPPAGTSSPPWGPTPASPSQAGWGATAPPQGEGWGSGAFTPPGSSFAATPGGYTPPNPFPPAPPPSSGGFPSGLPPFTPQFTAPAGPPSGGQQGTMVPCPVCLNPVNDRAKFCGHCGTNMTAQRTDAPPAMPTGDRTCTSCGLKTNKPSTFCPNCGSRMNG